MRRTCLNQVHELARRDDRVVYIGSDPGPGTLDAMREEFPDRFFVEGIAEANVVGMAAGLAMDGYIPFVNTIATFLTRRCYEQLAVDLCLHELPVRLIGNGGGLVYAPLGPTHTAVEDIALMRALPGMTVVAPTDAEEMTRFMPTTLDCPGPLYIRLAKGGDPVVAEADRPFALGRAVPVRDEGDVLAVTTGVMLHRVLAAADKAADPWSVLHMPTVKPLDTEALFAAAEGKRLLVTVEEHSLVGGLGSAVLEAFADAGRAMPQVLRLGLPDRFTHNYGSQDGLLAHYGLQPDGIAASVRDALA